MPIFMGRQRTRDKYRVGKNFNITEPKLPEGEYYYSFGIDDLFGSTKYLDLISFWVNKKGKVGKL